MSNKPKSKIIPRDNRKNTQSRIFSKNFQVNIDDSGIKCWVPWEDYLSLKTRYEKLVKRRRREIEQQRCIKLG